MVDTCDPTVACWSEDGETFVVKDPIKFEQQIIPQFFKHSKFSSFVRQLNFYAFRKIKYADTIRIDPKLEAETANYWRFRHEKFQRGKPELLQEIKRMNGQKLTSSNPKKITTSTSSTEKENTLLKTEVNQLKSRLEQMTKNIDELTSLVQKVTLCQETMITHQPSKPAAINSNNKRTKMDDPMPPLPDITHSYTVSKMELDPSDFQPPSIPSPVLQYDRTMTNHSDVSDDTFVDQLFTAFKTEQFDFEDSNGPQPPTPSQNNRPRPELMNKLSEALEVLPREIQQMIVDRLIQAITAPKEIQDNLEVAECLETATPAPVPQSPKDDSSSKAPTPNLPLAAATLAALLSQYGEDAVKAAAANATTKDEHKALLIPVHA